MLPASIFWASRGTGAFRRCWPIRRGKFTNKTGKVAPEHKRLARYATLGFDEIQALPVAAVTRETAHLYQVRFAPDSGPQAHHRGLSAKCQFRTHAPQHQRANCELARAPSKITLFGELPDAYSELIDFGKAVSSRPQLWEERKLC